MSSNSSELLAVGLYDRGAIGYATSKDPDLVGKPGGFVNLKSGRLSPTYVNLRGIPSLSSSSELPTVSQLLLRHQVINAYIDVIDDSPEKFNHLLGIPHAMTALGAMIGITSGHSVLSMRTEAKAHGISKTIEGDFAPGETVLGLDDVVTDGASKQETVEKIRGVGLVMKEFVVLVDRQEGGIPSLNKAGLKVYPALTMGEITEMLKANGRINDRQVYWTAEYFHNLLDSGIIDQMPPELANLA